MSDKFDKFTKRARRVLTFAQEEAQRLNHNYIGTEHILLGLIREEEGLAAKVLRDLGLDQTRVRQVIEEIVGRGQAAPGTRLSLTPRTKRVIELAVDEARRMGHHYIGTEHLLLGLIREGDGIAVNVLKSLGVSPDKVRSNLAKEVMNSTPAQSEQEKATAGGKQKRGESKTPLLDQLAIDLTSLAEENKLDPVIGRQKEIERVIQILSRRTKNNPALIGEPGVGKTAIVEGLAQRIIAGQVPQQLLNKRVLQLDVGSLVAGTIYRGQFEERMKRVIDEIKGSKSILFIDEIHMVVGAGSAGSAVDAANILKPALGRGELQCVGATTMEEYRKHIESDAALERRFQPVKVEEPSIEETILILRGVRERYEQHHALKIGDDALTSAAQLAARYVTDRFLPDKAIDLIDEASSRVRMYKAPKPAAWDELNEDLKTVQQRKEEAVDAEEFDEAIELQNRERAIIEKLKQVQVNTADYGDVAMPIVGAEDIAEVVSMWTGVPLTQISEAETTRLLKMEAALHERIVGQEDAINIISKAVRRARAGFKDPKRPIGSFIFLGPTGVGKTELAKTLAEFMFGKEDSLIHIDMSEFMERHSVARLVGAPPGYIGYEDGGQLTEAIRRRPYSVVLLDEIEKAHPEAFNLLLQILEEGHLADAKGRKVDFRNAIIIMTSNIGAEAIQRDGSLGFAVKKDEGKANEDAYAKMRERLMGELKKLFRPEFINRIDGVVVFRALTKDDILQIVDVQLRLLQPRLEEHNIELEITTAAKEQLAREGYDQQLGARPLKRKIQQLIEDPLSEGVLSGEFRDNSKVYADVIDGQVKLVSEELLTIDHALKTLATPSLN
ncbi:MAG: ATP-dependent Clp protease ATP-binding subunit ClpC [Anaerolineae bacterium]|nr:ATP-dependent Clp protease ATP-binding subunit ClpC [Anaerolineae bacterium]